VTEYYAIDFARVSSTILLMVTDGAIVGVKCSPRHNPHFLIGKQLEALPRRYRSRLRAITQAEFE
jgi:hypothetical protein